MDKKYDPKVKGRILSKEEIDNLKRIKPQFSSFTVDEPELTDELVKRMKNSKNVKKF